MSWRLTSALLHTRSMRCAEFKHVGCLGTFDGGHQVCQCPCHSDQPVAPVKANKHHGYGR